MKGKTTRKTPFRVEENIVYVPPELIKMHQDVTIGFDFMFVNGMIWFITVSRNIKFCTTEYVTSRSLSTAMACLETVINLYRKCGFKIRHALGDDEFSPMKPELED